MKLIYRPTEDRDLPECVPLVQHGLTPPGASARLLAAWRTLRARGAFNSAVMEDQDRAAGRRLVHFGCSVFITDEFVGEARARPHPCLSDLVLDRVAAGRSPVLDVAGVRRANTGDGLSVLVLHVGEAGDLSPAERLAVTARNPDTFFLVHQGFRLKEILMQLPDAAPQQFVLAGGFVWRHPETGLLGLTLAEAEAKPGTHAARLFAHEPPRLGLHPRDQELLQRALLGETDSEIADALGLAPNTVKARWRSVYDRVAERSPDLLPQVEPPDQRRGLEKRRRLLHYLRHHPEEMRPQ